MSSLFRFLGSFLFDHEQVYAHLSESKPCGFTITQNMPLLTGGKELWAVLYFVTNKGHLAIEPVRTVEYVCGFIMGKKPLAVQICTHKNF
jgi:hypothetical protein